MVTDPSAACKTNPPSSASMVSAAPALLFFFFRRPALTCRRDRLVELDASVAATDGATDLALFEGGGEGSSWAADEVEATGSPSWGGGPAEPGLAGIFRLRVVTMASPGSDPSSLDRDGRSSVRPDKDDDKTFKTRSRRGYK